MGIGGPGLLSRSGLTSAGNGASLSGTGGGGGVWIVASAAKHIFGRARSLSSPTSPKPATIRATSPNSFGDRPGSEPQCFQSSTGSITSIPMVSRIPTSSPLYPPSPNVSAPSLVVTSTTSSRRNSIDIVPSSSPIFPVTGTTKTLCNRGAAIISVNLAEPVLYLTGFDPSEYQDRSPAMLRGSLILKLLKPTKIRAITLVFKGRARTEWPEGIPPRRSDFFEDKDLMTHTWPFFNAQFTNSEFSHGADAARILDSQRHSMDLGRPSMDSVSSLSLSDNPSSRSPTPGGSPLLNSANPNGIWGIPFGQSRSFSKDDKTATQTRGYRIFAAGEYV